MPAEIEDLTDKKYFSRQITDRFLFAMDRIVGSRTGGKVTAEQFGTLVGISSSNLTRLRKSAGENTVTVEALGRICHHYKISAFWIMTGQGDMYSNDELASAYRTLERRLKEVELAINDIQQTMKILKKGR